MLKTKSILILIGTFFFFSNSYSQNNQEIKNNPFSNQIILSHYTVPELQQIELTDSLKFKTIVYYYTQSFSIESVVCSDCIQTDLVNFDISKFEYLRKQSTSYTKDFTKYGFRLTLVSIDELAYKMPIHLPLNTSINEDDE